MGVPHLHLDWCGKSPRHHKESWDSVILTQISWHQEDTGNKAFWFWAWKQVFLCYWLCCLGLMQKLCTKNPNILRILQSSRKQRKSTSCRKSDNTSSLLWSVQVFRVQRDIFGMPFLFSETLSMLRQWQHMGSGQVPFCHFFAKIVNVHIHPFHVLSKCLCGTQVELASSQHSCFKGQSQFSHFTNCVCSRSFGRQTFLVDF